MATCLNLPDVPQHCLLQWTLYTPCDTGDMMNGIAQALRAVRDVVTHARSSSELFKLIRPGEGEVLNALIDGAPREPVSTSDVLARLSGLRRDLEAEAYVTAQARVDYARLAASPTFLELVDAARGLHGVQLVELSDARQRKAFLINLYNVLMIHSVIVLEIERSVMEVPTIFSAVGYQVGEHVWTLDGLEHGALRGNAAHPTTRRRMFAEGDGRVAWSVPLDARIHAALVCAANSCPPIRMYDGEEIDEQLDLASSSFVQGATRVDHVASQVWTSAIFGWYEQDFASTGGVPAFLVRHAEAELRQDLSRAFEAGYALKYSSYDWSLNRL